MAGCSSTPPNIGDGTVTWKHYVSGGYSYRTFRYLSRKAPVLIDFAGLSSVSQPDAFKSVVHQSISNTHALYGRETVIDPLQPHGEAIRLVILANPTLAVPSADICDKERVLENYASQGKEDRLEILIAYCKRDQTLSSAFGAVYNYRDANGGRLEKLVKNGIRNVLPRRNPEAGGNCSDDITLDC